LHCSKVTDMAKECACLLCELAVCFVTRDLVQQ